MLRGDFMKILTSKDYYILRVFLCTVVLVAIYLAWREDFYQYWYKVVAYSIGMWLYYCIVFVAADSFKPKNLGKKKDNHS